MTEILDEQQYGRQPSYIPAEEAFGATKTYTSEQHACGRQQPLHSGTAFPGKQKAVKLKHMLCPHTSHWHFAVKHGDSFSPHSSLKAACKQSMSWILLELAQLWILSAADLLPLQAQSQTANFIFIQKGMAATEIWFASVQSKHTFARHKNKNSTQKKTQYNNPSPPKTQNQATKTHQATN